MLICGDSSDSERTLKNMVHKFLVAFIPIFVAIDAVELNWRYQHGDKTAELKEFWPSSRRHIASSPETAF